MKGTFDCLLCAVWCCCCGSPLGKMIGELGEESTLAEGLRTFEERAPPLTRLLLTASLDKGTSCPVLEFMAKGNNTKGLVETAM